jgi:hypothetical protein
MINNKCEHCGREYISTAYSFRAWNGRHVVCHDCWQDIYRNDYKNKPDTEILEVIKPIASE